MSYTVTHFHTNWGCSAQIAETRQVSPLDRGPVIELQADSCGARPHHAGLGGGDTLEIVQTIATFLGRHANVRLPEVIPPTIGALVARAELHNSGGELDGLAALAGLTSPESVPAPEVAVASPLHS